MAVEGWVVCEFGDVAKLEKGISYSAKDYCEEGEGHPFITIKCFGKGGGYSDRGIKHYKGAFKSAQKASSGDIVIANTDLTRNGAIIGSPIIIPNKFKKSGALLSMDLSKVCVNSQTSDSKFLYYTLMSSPVRGFMKARSAGSTVLHLQTKAVPKMKISLPPLPEQKKIAEILGSVDEAIAKTEAVIKQTQRVKQGLLQTLLTRGIGHTKFKQTKVGEIPDNWSVEPASIVCEEVIDCKNRTPPVSVCETEYVVIRTPNVKKGRFLKKPETYTDESSFHEWTKRGVPRGGDVVITREAPVGEVCIIPEGLQACLGQRTMLYRPDQNIITSKFLLYALLSPESQNRLLLKAGGSTVGHVRVGDIREFPVPVPPLSEQKQIVAYIDESVNDIRSNEQMLTTLKQLKKGLMADLLTGRVRVNVDQLQEDAA